MVTIRWGAREDRLVERNLSGPGTSWVGIVSKGPGKCIEAYLYSPSAATLSSSISPWIVDSASAAIEKNMSWGKKCTSVYERILERK